MTTDEMLVEVLAQLRAVRALLEPQAPRDPMALPPPASPLLSGRERVLLDAAARGPLTATDAQAALVAAGLLRRTPKVLRCVRSLLSRMAHQRGLLTPPDAEHRYHATPLGLAALAGKT